MSLSAPTIALLDHSVEVDMRTPRRDGSTSDRPIWVVVVDGDAYVRSYRGPRGAWYRHARHDGRAVIVAEQQTLPVTLEPVADEDLNRRISDAFRAKYGAASPTSTEAMVAEEVAATTLRLGAAAT